MSNKSENSQEPSKYLIWIDLEMTGLNPKVDCIIEIATLVTDNNLNIIAEGPELAIHQSDSVLANMNEWCIEQHGKSGLTQRVRESKISTAQAEQQTMEFLKQYLKPGESPMCGNSVHQDRRFLYQYMPDLVEFFHYRNLDVSTLKELSSRWGYQAKFEKESNHLAMDDIKASIEELQFYRDKLFVGL